MFDDLPGGADIIKPALKGHEGRKAPWETRSHRGCTFWKKGKCELHEIGLKPLQGKLAHHDHSMEQVNEIAHHINESWETEFAKEVIEKWKTEYLHD